MSLKILPDASNIPSDQLDDWGHRTGTKEPGTCAMLGTKISEANGVKTGIWECKPGTFDVVKRENVESVIILSGVVKLTDLDCGIETSLKAGDVATLEKGSSVRWEIVETVRKLYVVAGGD